MSAVTETGSLPPSYRYTLISADCHAGGNHEQYRSYLERKYLDEFDAWRGRYSNPFKDLTTGTRDRNWNNERRIAEQEADGCVAEVLFPNTIPPFFPTGAVIARPPTPDEYELRLAGIRAHNRWLADWCATHPERRAGIGQIFLNNIDDAISEATWCKEHGLRGGILLQPVPDDMKHLEPLYSPAYDRLWEVCEDLEIIVNSHSGGAAMPDYGNYPVSGFVWMAEATFFSRRPLTHLLIGGVFARFPRLRFAMTETGCSWIPDTLAQLDHFHAQVKRSGRIGEIPYDPDSTPPLKPSEYFATNCWVGCSFPSPSEVSVRHAIGDERFMWGSDYPHDESTFPHTREGLRRAFRGLDPVEITRLVSGNVAALYGFDLEVLAKYASACGPTVAELQEPYEGVPEGNRSPAFVRR